MHMVMAFDQQSTSDYPRMEALSDKWSFDYDAYRTTTTDGYILSVFNILPTLAPGETRPKASVLIQHGN